MTTPRKLTRAEVCKQIDDFRGTFRPGTDGKPLLAPWVASKRVDTEPPPRRARNGKAMNHGWTRIRAN
ncbi:MAG: hypothetical protein ABSH11_06525 [Verrucomicrobiota bacterium]|jgi:hypothetical protein